MYIIVNEENKITKVSLSNDNEGMIFIENYPADLILNPAKYLFVDNGFIDNPDYIEPIKEEILE